MMRAKKMGGIFLLCALLCLTSGCKKGEEALTPPAAYMVGEESIPALELPEEGGMLSEAHYAADEEELAGDVYTYAEMAQSGALVESYAGKMTGENGFTVVDEQDAETEPPDFTAAEGTVRLARETGAEGELLTVKLDWGEESCTVTVEVREGSIERAEAEGMTAREAAEYLESLSPADLGLSGSSMAEYRVYPLSGIVLVDGNSCMQLNVYSVDNEAQTNDLLGSYLLTGDKAHLYRLDRQSGTVTELRVS